MESLISFKDKSNAHVLGSDHSGCSKPGALMLLNVESTRPQVSDKKRKSLDSGFQI